MIYTFLYIPRIFLEQKKIYIPRIFLEQKNDIPRIFLEQECIFLPVNVTFYDAVTMIHYVIRTANPFPCTAKFMFDCVRNNKTQQMKR